MLVIFASAAGALVVIGLTILSIFASVLTRQLSLPDPLLGHLLSILLPTFTFLGLLYPSFLTKTLLARQQAALLSVLSLLDTVLVTLASTLLQPNLLSCDLEHRWRTLFQHHNAKAIRTIQDALECCGLRTSVDQAWPFPDKSHGATACRENLGRERSCEAPWRAREVQILAIWITVGVTGLAVKAIFVLLRRNRPAWFQVEAARNRQYPRGRITDPNDEHVAGAGRYLDQPSEETPLRAPEAHAENELSH